MNKLHVLMQCRQITLRLCVTSAPLLVEGFISGHQTGKTLVILMKICLMNALKMLSIVRYLRVYTFVDWNIN